MMSGTQTRDDHFATRYCQLMIRARAVQVIGKRAAWLCTVLAHLADERGVVRIFESELLPVLGFSNPGMLYDARGRAVEAGWLAHDHDAAGKQLRDVYRLTIPGWCAVYFDPAGGSPA
jgi:hypothetical protein